MNINDYLPTIVSTLTSIASAYVACKVAIAKIEEQVLGIKDDIKTLKNEVQKIYELDKRLTVLEMKNNKEE